MDHKSSGVKWIGFLLIVLCITGCTDRGELVRVSQDRDAARAEGQRMQRVLEDQRRQIMGLERQVRDLQRFNDEKPADLFSPSRIEIVSRSGGSNYDDVPGDDGVTVHIRPVDADGHAVKVPGEIRVQLLDNTQLGRPALLGVCVYNDPDELRRMWHGLFGTNHYTAQCRFSPGKGAPSGGRVLVTVEFTDFLTGSTLVANKEVEVQPAP